VLGYLAAALARFSARYVPSALSIAIILSALVFAAGVLWGDATPIACVSAWGAGFWTLLEFGMQMCVIIFAGYIVAVAPPVGRLLDRLATVPRTPTGAVAFMAASSMVMCWLNWGLGLVASAVLVRALARRQPRADYRLLVATAYFGLGTTWHAGPSGSVPLLLATPGHFLAERVGVIPVTETILTSFNLLLVLAVSVTMTVVAALMHPKPAQRITASQAGLEEKPKPTPPAPTTPAAKVDASPWLGIFLGGLGVLYLITYFYRQGLALNLNIVNLGFLTLGICLHRSPASLERAAEEASRLLHGIVLQFPLYAGMFGIIRDTALAAKMAHLFVSIATPTTFPVVVCLYSSVLNYFVPSGGSKWAIEAPYLIEAAKALGVPVGRMAMAYAYGDMGTNLIQPFWAIPLLAVAGLDFKDILGFEVLALLLYLLIVCGALFLAP